MKLMLLTAWPRLKERPLGIVAGARDVHKALEFLQKAHEDYGMLDDLRKHDLMSAAAKLAGMASKNPAFGLLLDADQWAAYQVYGSVNAVNQVHKLTLIGEGDLQLLKTVSDRLRNEVNQLTGVKKQLAYLGPKCSSTNLVTHSP